MRTFLEIAATRETPRVYYDEKLEAIVISGEATPENAEKFWTPVLQRIHDIAVAGGRNMCVVCDIRYYNTSSSKYLMELFSMLNTQYEHARAIGSEQDISVVWRWETTPEDEPYDREEAEEWLSPLWSMPFQLVRVLRGSHSTSSLS